VTALLPYLERFCFVKFTRVSAVPKVERKTLSNMTHLLSENKGYSYIINICCILLYLQFRTHYKPKPYTHSQYSAHFTADALLGLRIHRPFSGKYNISSKFWYFFNIVKHETFFSLNKILFFMCR
jgi:hypothetical protein